MSGPACPPDDRAAAVADATEPRVPGTVRAAAALLAVAVVTLGVAVIATDVFWGVILIGAGLFAWRGFRIGPWQACGGLVGLLAVWAWAVPLGKGLTPLLRSGGLPLIHARVASTVLAAGLLLLCGQWVGRWITRRVIRRHGLPGRTARGFGLCCGFVEGGLVALTLSLAVVAVTPPLRMGLSLILPGQPWAVPIYQRLVQLRAHTLSAPLGRELAQRFAEPHRVLEVGASLAAISKYPNALPRLKNDPVIVELLAEDAALQRVVREIQLDWGLKRAVQTGDIESMLTNRTVLRLLEDQRLAATLEAHRGALLAALLDSVDSGRRDQATDDLARLHGITLDELRAIVQTRVMTAGGRAALN